MRIQRRELAVALTCNHQQVMVGGPREEHRGRRGRTLGDGSRQVAVAPCARAMEASPTFVQGPLLLQGVQTKLEELR